jgi:hypothetical protein
MTKEEFQSRLTAAEKLHRRIPWSFLACCWFAGIMSTCWILLLMVFPDADSYKKQMRLFYLGGFLAWGVMVFAIVTSMTGLRPWARRIVKLSMGGGLIFVVWHAWNSNPAHGFLLGALVVCLLLASALAVADWLLQRKLTKLKCPSCAKVLTGAAGETVLAIGLCQFCQTRVIEP